MKVDTYTRISEDSSELSCDFKELKDTNNDYTVILVCLDIKLIVIQLKDDKLYHTKNFSEQENLKKTSLTSMETKLFRYSKLSTSLPY